MLKVGMIGVIIGIMGEMFGLGKGFLIVPFLRLVLKFLMPTAVCSVLAGGTFTCVLGREWCIRGQVMLNYSQSFFLGI